MATVFESETRLGAWLDATEYLFQRGSSLNVILSISSPGSDGIVANQAMTLMDKFLAEEDVLPIHSVAELIFPAWEYTRRGLRGVYETYPNEEYPVLKKGAPQRWGSYAHRLLRRRTGTGDIVNPLAILIEKMKSELRKKQGGAFRSCYELGIAEGEYDLPLYNTVDDQRRRRGGPCLSHLSFKLMERNVHLTAVYRSHDYRYKVPGNLLGLARLQACIAKEVGAKIGSLVVHSTYAYLELGKGKQPLKALLAQLRQLMLRGNGK
jgi:hypothetical protein